MPFQEVIYLVEENAAATGNTTHGYFGGGQDSPEYTKWINWFILMIHVLMSPSAALMMHSEWH